MTTLGGPRVCQTIRHISWAPRASSSCCPYSSRLFGPPHNLTNIMRQTSVIGIMAVGMTFVILTAGIDLSVGSILR